MNRKNRPARLKCKGCRYCPCARTAVDPITGKMTTPYRDRRYLAWRDIKMACYNVNFQRYKYNGALGVEMYPAWQSCANFILWAELQGWLDPTKRFAVTRHDTYADYTPMNCYLVPIKDGCNASSLIATMYRPWPEFGEHTLHEWAYYCDIPYSALRKRLCRGWPLNYALIVDLNQRLPQGRGVLTNLYLAKVDKIRQRGA